TDSAKLPPMTVENMLHKKKGLSSLLTVSSGNEWRMDATRRLIFKLIISKVAVFRLTSNEWHSLFPSSSWPLFWSYRSALAHCFFSDIAEPRRYRQHRDLPSARAERSRRTCAVR